jgi:Flp pilus assembly protein TadB
MILIVATLAAFVVGLAVESHWCGHRHQASRWEAVARREHDRHLEAVKAAKRWASAAKHWHRQYGEASRTSESHAAVLAALGRAVSEGGSISEGKAHE